MNTLPPNPCPCNPTIGENCPECYVAATKHALERIALKPRTTVKRFASDLKSRIERAAVAFDQPGQSDLVRGMRYVLGIVDAALSDYDVREPGDT